MTPTFYFSISPCCFKFSLRYTYLLSLFRGEKRTLALSGLHTLAPRQNQSNWKHTRDDLRYFNTRSNTAARPNLWCWVKQRGNYIAAATKQDILQHLDQSLTFSVASFQNYQRTHGSYVWSMTKSSSHLSSRHHNRGYLGLYLCSCNATWYTHTSHHQGILVL